MIVLTSTSSLVYLKNNGKGANKYMKLHFLGTAAAEGFPNPFCSCEACQDARRLGGRNIRSRTSAIIDDELKIDYPADSFYHAIRDNIDLAKIKDLLFTHTHSDHYIPQELEKRIEGFAHGIEHPLNIYGNDSIVQGLLKNFPNAHEGDRLRFHRLLPFQKTKIETAEVTPLLAEHDPMETCYLYYIEKDGKKILYGHDTGWFLEETWDWLKHHKIDLAILDCTGGYNNDKRARRHMCIETVVEVQRVFRGEAILERDGQIVATHFTHNSGLLHDDFVKAFEPYGIQVAYDGMVIHV